MKKYIVTTSISECTKATDLYSKLTEWNLIFVADKNTPLESYQHLNCDILTCEQQDLKWPYLSGLIGWNKPERKTLGVLEAYSRGAEVIAIVDDDNIPLDNWGKNLIIGKETFVNFVKTEELCFDPLYHTNYPHLWHRGFPIQLLKSRDKYEMNKVKVIPHIQSGLWNNEPDIDAVCRMEYSPICKFEVNRFPIASDAFSPFNSQNTILSRIAARNYFMMFGTGRMTDIWASYYLQSKGFINVYTATDVYHDRFVHSNIEDFLQEIEGYHKTLSLLNDLKKNPEYISNYISEDCYSALKEYQRIINELDKLDEQL